MLECDLFGDTIPLERHTATLSDTWEYPPFSVLSARDGWWQERKRQWLGLGIKSEIGRGDNGMAAPGDGTGRSKFGKVLETGIGEKYGREEMNATSIFDPVVCELAYRWFCPPGGQIVDPFAGGSVRGIVAGHLGRPYLGVDLRAEQVAANIAQQHLSPAPKPGWVCGDSRGIGALCGGVAADFIFSCPPYADLEVYSDDPRDISTLPYPAFRAAYFEIIAEACKLLRPDRFACFVVGEARDKAGHYYNLVGDTVEAFRAAGLHYYNEAVLVTAVGSLPVRVGRQFAAGRKLGKTHQNILVFVKGCGRAASRRMENAVD